MSEIVLAALIAALASIVTAVLQLHTRREQKNITNKVDETHRQVTINNHSSKEPTILDKLDDLTREVQLVRTWQVGHDIQHDLERRQDGK